jgi:NAD+ diphosphatase
VIELPFNSPHGYVHATEIESVGEGHWFVFRRDQLLVEVGPPSQKPSDDARVPVRPSWARIPYGAPPGPIAEQPLRTLYLGQLAGKHLFAAEAPAESVAPAGTSWEGLRVLFSVLDDAHFALAGRALQLIDWDRTHQFCGRCGARTETRPGERVRVCTACKLAAYPRVAPAVMALVRRGRELLLGRSPHFPPGMYSALAGFVEPGESLEQCLRREVAEEVGIEVANVAYFASQPWPFPHSLMIAFTCDWTAGEPRPQPGEIEAADWFDVFQLPRLPSKISIARRLIDAVAVKIRGEFETGV